VGTGSEVSKVAVISDPEHSFKKGMLSPLMFPHAAIGDTKLIWGFPRNFNTASGLDAFVRLRTNPFSDQFALVDILRFNAPSISPLFDIPISLNEQTR
jgi:alcohol dehydrogenase class IV